ncbi:MAG: CRISPR-associated endonuclease Cas1, partial [Elainellaceae cyanobacterium]
SRAAGIDGITPELFTGIAADQLRYLGRQLHREIYNARPAKGFWLPKKSGGKRLIGIPTVGDRIVQRFLLQLIYPSLERRFSEAAFAYRPGLSIYSAVERVMERYRHPPTWVVKADIQQFFDTLAWPLLMQQVEGLGLSPWTIRLIEQQLKAGVVLSGQFCPTGRGVLQGGVLSGALANLYLSEFDHLCLDAGIDLVRYGDDCVAVCQSLLEAHRSLALMRDWLSDLYLTVHPDKTRVVGPEETFVFLGHTFAQGQVTRNATSSPKPPQPPRRPTPAGIPKLCSLRKAKQPTYSPKNQSNDHWRDGMTTLYVTDQNAYLRIRNQQYQISHDSEVRASVPASRVSHVVLFGSCNVSHGAVSLSLRRRIPLLYLSTKGKYFGRLQTSGQAKIDYLTQQVHKSLDTDFVQRQAASIIVGKLRNSRTLLLRLNRRRKTEVATEAIAAMAQLIEAVPQAESVEAMLGYEGQAANLYFRAYATLLKGPFAFEKRTRRPPTDPVNSLMSLGYTLLFDNLHAMVEGVGLHTHFGNLHAPQSNRPSLVCDLVEEFRAFVVDALVAYLINSNIFEPEDFTPPDERGGVYLHPDGLKRFLKHWEEKLQQTITHPHTGYKVSYRRCLELQVWEYIACLTGEQETYRPMVWEG